MTNHTALLKRISSDEGLAQQLRQGHLGAFEKLHLSFDQLYGSVGGEDKFDEQTLAGCTFVSCTAPSGCVVTSPALTE
ncbi:MAG TPA: hypothetical protein VJA94_07775 [Candidatus Angelobacter sp.]